MSSSTEPLTTDPNQPPKYKDKLHDGDYLQLWEYFDTHDGELKQRMFQIVTWVIGFAVAILSFILATFVDTSQSAFIIKERLLAVLLCLAGLVLCGYAGLILAHYARHIEQNWGRSDECAKVIEGLSDLTKGQPEEQRTRWLVLLRWKLRIWSIVGIVVAFVAVAFVAVGVFVILWQG